MKFIKPHLLAPPPSLYVGSKIEIPLLNPLSVKPTKWSNTLKQFLGDSRRVNHLNVFDHFVGLAVKGLILHPPPPSPAPPPITIRLLRVRVAFDFALNNRITKE